MNKNIAELAELLKIADNIPLFTHTSVEEIKCILQKYGAENKGFLLACCCRNWLYQRCQSRTEAQNNKE